MRCVSRAAASAATLRTHGWRRFHPHGGFLPETLHLTTSLARGGDR